MKSLVVLLTLMVSGLCYSQISERIQIDGRIEVPEGDDPAGITIINTTTSRGTVSGENGEFTMAVGLGDELVISAIQFQEFRVIINQNVMDAGVLTVFISEATTELPEVVVRPLDLSGNVEVDVARIPTVENLPLLTEEEINSVEWDFRPDSMTSPENAAMRDSFMEYGLNFANIFRALIESREEGVEEFQPEDLRELYDDEFFREHLDLKKQDITSFILFAEENGLSPEMLQEGNELDLVEFLLEQRDLYKKQFGTY